VHSSGKGHGFLTQARLPSRTSEVLGEARQRLGDVWVKRRQASIVQT
jgi:hypothetical protein